MQIEDEKVSFLEALGRLLGGQKEGKIMTVSRGANIEFDILSASRMPPPLKIQC